MLLSRVAYEQGRRIGDISVSETRSFRRPGCFVWVAIRDPDPAEVEAPQAEFDLHDLAVEDAQGGHQRPKLEEYGSTLFAVVQTIEHSERELHAGEAGIFVGQDFVLSIRRATRMVVCRRARANRTRSVAEAAIISSTALGSSRRMQVVPRRPESPVRSFRTPFVVAKAAKQASPNERSEAVCSTQ